MNEWAKSVAPLTPIKDLSFSLGENDRMEEEYADEGIMKGE